MASVPCSVCGEQFHRPNMVGPIPKYCSRKCWNQARRVGGPLHKSKKSEGPATHIAYADCAHCGCLFVRRTRTPGNGVYVCRNPECQRLQRNQQMRDWFRRYRAENGEAYTNRYRDKRKASMRQRINRKLSLPYEEFTDDEIFERDGWSCGICGEPVDRELKWPDPMSKSLDHVRPLAKGGHHVRTNCQLAHLSCNVSKGDKEVEDGRSGTAA